MIRKLALVLPALLLLSGCAGTAKLTQKSEQRLARGDSWKAWQLAIRALDKEPGNPAARSAATAAGAAIAQEWERKIHALADADSVNAAAEVVEFGRWRAEVARYATIPTSPGWTGEERTLRQTAARIHYARGQQALDARRPKKANGHFTEANRYVPDYRDATQLADRTMVMALTRLAVVPFRGGNGLGAQVADAWRQDLTRAMEADARFTRLLSADAIERSMTVSQLGQVTREEALRLGRKAGAQRVVWGSVGDVTTSTRLEFFRETICRRVRETRPDGEVVTRWVDVPIEVVARVRDVDVDVNYDVIATRDGASLAQKRFARSRSARVVWTSYQPEGDIESYALVSETVRSGNPERAKSVESRWKLVCGESTTLRQVLEARLASRGGNHYTRDVLPRFIAGAAFVFLEELPPANDLAFAALVSGVAPLREDLLRLDPIDDVDLGIGATTSREK